MDQQKQIQASTPKFKNYFQMIKALPDDSSCREYLEEVIWNGTPHCPHCKKSDKGHYMEIPVKLTT